jgi:sulfur-carrier protein adenylyltransferase/sulfurtransferase
MREIDFTQAQSQVGNGSSVFVDVREEDETSKGHIEGALFVPLSGFEDDLPEVVPDKNQAIVFYCAAGRRSLMAAEAAENDGYSNVSSMAGGFEGWKGDGRDWVKP